MTDLPSGARPESTAQGWPDDDRGLGRQQAALGLVDRARDAVEAGRDVHDGRAREALGLGRGPLRQLVEREVDLHARAAVAEGLRGLPGRRAGPRPRAAAGRRAACGVTLAITAREAETISPSRQPHAVGAAAGDEHALDVGAGAQLAAVLAHDRRQRLDEAHAAAARHGHAAELDRAGDDLRHEARDGLLGPEARVQHPGREQAVGALGLERRARASRARSRARCRRTSSSPRRPKLP